MMVDTIIHAGLTNKLRIFLKSHGFSLKSNPFERAAFSHHSTAHQYARKSAGLVRSYLADRNVASISPSSSFVQKAVCKQINFRSAHTIVEFGPGDGAITSSMLAKMTGHSQLFAFETNRDLIQTLNSTCNDSRLRAIHASAETAENFCRDMGCEADVVVSGIPFSYLSDAQALGLIRSVNRMLKPDGIFIVYQAYCPPLYRTTRLQQLLRSAFEIAHTERVLLNIPPLEVISCLSRRY